MGAEILNRINYLLQKDIFDQYINSIGKNKWVTAHCSEDNESQRLGFHCALMTEKAAKRALSRFAWDLMVDEGGPGFIVSNSGGKSIAKYRRYGARDGIRQLVMRRYFYSAFDSYYEFDEEFRLYHNLAEDRNTRSLLAFDSSGRKIEVARMNSDVIEVQLKYVKRFQAATRLYLVIYFDVVRYSGVDIELVPAGAVSQEVVASDRCWRFCVMKDDYNPEFNTFSRLLGKIIVPPPPREQSGVWPFEEKQSEPDVDFIISVDENGNSVKFTSNPDKLGNFFGANPGAPNYLTPVYFRREVLQKYYSEPERYKVSDGYLSCLDLWGMQIDNNLRGHVFVYLGDLGRDLPYRERLHWKQFNVEPEGVISKTNFERSVLAKFSEPISLDLVFRNSYIRLKNAWRDKQGWQLFLDPNPGDAHLIDTIRIPVTNAQPEFDEQVLHLTKLMVDSLNEKELRGRSTATDKDAKGIRKLHNYFLDTKFPCTQEVIGFLKRLQELRSTGSGHRKGARYGEIVNSMGVDIARRQELFSELLKQAITSLQAMYLFFCGGKISS